MPNAKCQMPSAKCQMPNDGLKKITIFGLRFINESDEAILQLNPMKARVFIQENNIV